jgi:hypothetical protein
MTGWQRSSYCDAGGCVEVRLAGGRVVVRDSNRPAESLWCRPEDLAVFILAVKAGEFDLIAGLTKGATA